MRKELELIEKIELYLSETMDFDEKRLFKKQINADDELKEQVELQKEIMQGIQRMVWKKEVKIALKKYKFTSNLLKWSFIGLNISVLFLMVAYFSNIADSSFNSTPQVNKQTENQSTIKLKDSVEAYDFLYGNSFVINTSRDTVVKTKDGTMIEIPGNIFSDTNQLCESDTQQLTIKENRTIPTKIYTLHFFSPNYIDSLKKWTHALKHKNFSKFYHSVIASLKPQNYIAASSDYKQLQIGNDKRLNTTETIQNKDTICTAACGINIEKIPLDTLQTKPRLLYKLKGKIPFIKKISKAQNTILVFDINNKNKTSIDSALVIELSEELEKLPITTKTQSKRKQKKQP